MNAIKRFCEELKKELETRGIEARYSTSDTDYGISSYFTFYKNPHSLECYKVRISDHSVTNIDRIRNERHVNLERDTPERVANGVELYLFPERFEFVEDSKNFTHIREGKKVRVIKK